jgi:hypothetical protein
MARMDQERENQRLQSGATLRLQREALQIRGLIVKNTFIDEPRTSEDEEDGSGKGMKRVHSSPSLLQAAGVVGLSEALAGGSSDQSPISESGSSWHTPVSRGRRTRRACEISRLCIRATDVESSSGTTSPSTSTVYFSGEEAQCEGSSEPVLTRSFSGCSDESGVIICIHFASKAKRAQGVVVTSKELYVGVQLAALIERSCKFLRLTDYKVHKESSSVRQMRGAASCILFYVRGLPWVKRDKWLLPLFWSLAPLLKAQGCSVKIQSSELYVTLPEQCPGTSADYTDWIRVEFAAARS